MFKKILFVCIPLMLIFVMLAVPVSADVYCEYSSISGDAPLVDVEWDDPVGTMYLGDLNVTLTDTNKKVDLTGFYGLKITQGIYYEGDIGDKVFGDVFEKFNFIKYAKLNDNYYTFVDIVSGNDGWYLVTSNGQQIFLASFYGTAMRDLDFTLIIDSYPFDITNGNDSREWGVDVTEGETSNGYFTHFDVYYLGATPPEPETVMSVWSKIMTWITTAIASVQAVFYVNGSLTFIGTLAIIGVSIAIAWLIISVVERFLRLRG